MAEKLAPERHDFVHNGQKVFEWDQTLEEVNLYITLPPNVHPKAFHCRIQSKHLEVGIKGNPPYLNHDLSAPVKTDCSFWTLEDDIMHITLQKREKGQTWASPILGQGQLDPYATDAELITTSESLRYLTEAGGPKSTTNTELCGGIRI
ncbi:hypothetical protein Bca52824_004639 [Brassica carinata]|uniref:CS domain-containing protein n=1 Tax=Brassica carinata TaxID=52824 RepID=A0A8X8BCH0_BRACI|nr:hypothetical protein Bca52824_004639 [Brassica carinata]